MYGLRSVCTLPNSQRLSMLPASAGKYCLGNEQIELANHRPDYDPDACGCRYGLLADSGRQASVSGTTFNIGKPTCQRLLGDHQCMLLFRVLLLRGPAGKTSERFPKLSQSGGQLQQGQLGRRPSCCPCQLLHSRKQYYDISATPTASNQLLRSRKQCTEQRGLNASRGLQHWHLPRISLRQQRVRYARQRDY